MIYSIKLNTTEELLVQRVSEDENAIYVTRPLVYNINPQTQELILVPWLLGIGILSTSTISIYKHAVISKNEVHPELATRYHQIINAMINPAPPMAAQTQLSQK